MKRFRLSETDKLLLQKVNKNILPCTVEKYLVTAEAGNKNNFIVQTAHT